MRIFKSIVIMLVCFVLCGFSVYADDVAVTTIKVSANSTRLVGETQKLKLILSILLYTFHANKFQLMQTTG